MKENMEFRDFSSIESVDQGIVVLKENISKYPRVQAELADIIAVRTFKNGKEPSIGEIKHLSESKVVPPSQGELITTLGSRAPRRLDYSETVKNSNMLTSVVEGISIVAMMAWVLEGMSSIRGGDVEWLNGYYLFLSWILSLIASGQINSKYLLKKQVAQSSNKDNARRKAEKLAAKVDEFIKHYQKADMPSLKMMSGELTALSIEIDNLEAILKAVEEERMNLQLKRVKEQTRNRVLSSVAEAETRADQLGLEISKAEIHQEISEQGVGIYEVATEGAIQELYNVTSAELESELEATPEELEEEEVVEVAEVQEVVRDAARAGTASK